MRGHRPTERDRELVHRVLFEELTRGVIDERSRGEYLRIISDLVDTDAQGIVLGCAEIGQLITAPDCPDTVLYDTAALHSTAPCA